MTESVTVAIVGCAMASYSESVGWPTYLVVFDFMHSGCLAPLHLVQSSVRASLSLMSVTCFPGNGVYHVFIFLSNDKERVVSRASLFLISNQFDDLSTFFPLPSVSWDCVEERHEFAVSL